MPTPGPDMWNARYGAAEYAYGTEPNVFFAEQLGQLTPGKLLLPAEGEGRNAVYAASNGWEVSAFDIAIEGHNKAQRLAQTLGVSVDYRVGDFLEMNFEPGSFDAVGLIYSHFPPPLRPAFHQRIMDLLKRGGQVILEGFSTGHIPYKKANPKVGGPEALPVLFDPQTLPAEFPGLQIQSLQDLEVELNEGLYHVGVGRVLRLVGVKH